MPFGPYKDFDACVAANGDKDNPQAYCAAVHKKATGKWPSENAEVTGSTINLAEKLLMTSDFQLSPAMQPILDQLLDLLGPEELVAKIRDLWKKGHLTTADKLELMRKLRERGIEFGGGDATEAKEVGANFVAGGHIVLGLAALAAIASAIFALRRSAERDRLLDVAAGLADQVQSGELEVDEAIESLRSQVRSANLQPMEKGQVLTKGRGVIRRAEGSMISPLSEFQNFDIVLGKLLDRIAKWAGIPSVKVTPGVIYVAAEEGVITEDEAELLGTMKLPTTEDILAFPRTAGLSMQSEHRFGELQYILKDIPIFASGKHTDSQGKERKWSDKDLKAMLEAFDSKVPAVVPIKLGHSSDSFNDRVAEALGIPVEVVKGEGDHGTGAARLGEVVGISYKDGQLYADIEAANEKVADIIKGGYFTGVSSEIQETREQDGKKYGPVLTGLALLGAQRPALPELHDVLVGKLAESERSKVHFYLSDFDDIPWGDPWTNVGYVPQEQATAPVQEGKKNELWEVPMREIVRGSTIYTTVSAPDQLSAGRVALRALDAFLQGGSPIIGRVFGTAIAIAALRFAPGVPKLLKSIGKYVIPGQILFQEGSMTTEQFADYDFVLGRIAKVAAGVARGGARRLRRLVRRIKRRRQRSPQVQQARRLAGTVTSRRVARAAGFNPSSAERRKARRLAYRNLRGQQKALGLAEYEYEGVSFADEAFDELDEVFQEIAQMSDKELEVEINLAEEESDQFEATLESVKEFLEVDTVTEMDIRDLHVQGLITDEELTILLEEGSMTTKTTDIQFADYDFVLGRVARAAVKVAGSGARRLRRLVRRVRARTRRRSPEIRQARALSKIKAQTFPRSVRRAARQGAYQGLRSRRPRSALSEWDNSFADEAFDELDEVLQEIAKMSDQELETEIKLSEEEMDQFEATLDSVKEFLGIEVVTEMDVRDLHMQGLITEEEMTVLLAQLGMVEDIAEVDQIVEGMTDNDLVSEGSDLSEGDSSEFAMSDKTKRRLRIAAYIAGFPGITGAYLLGRHIARKRKARRRNLSEEGETMKDEELRQILGIDNGANLAEEVKKLVTNRGHFSETQFAEERRQLTSRIAVLERRDRVHQYMEATSGLVIAGTPLELATKLVDIEEKAGKANAQALLTEWQGITKYAEEQGVLKPILSSRSEVEKPDPFEVKVQKYSDDHKVSFNVALASMAMEDSKGLTEYRARKMEAGANRK